MQRQGKFIFIPIYYGKNKTSHTTGITVDVLKNIIFSFNPGRKYGIRRKSEQELAENITTKGVKADKFLQIGKELTTSK